MTVERGSPEGPDGNGFEPTPQLLRNRRSDAAKGDPVALRDKQLVKVSRVAADCSNAYADIAVA